MERLFTDGKAAEIIPYDMDSPLLLFPIRHHSPVCSYQLVRTIAEYKPDIILIEGPENANELIPVLSDENTRLPAAFYCFYKDRKKLVTEDAEDHKCYYPFLYASPEYNAVKQAKKLGIPSKFIDLPYYEILIHTEKNEGLRKEEAGKKQTYGDDSRLILSKFYDILCEKTNIRTFEEFWEKYFEISGIYLTPKQFVKQMHTYCILTRQYENEDRLKKDATLERETHMAYNILAAMQEYKRVLVVTGGFHSIGIYKIIQNGSVKPVKQHKIHDGDSGCFPTVFSYENSDALHGYASGMRTPKFYDEIAVKLLQNDEPDSVYDYVTLDLLALTAKECAKSDIPVSMADVSAARSLMQGLCALRNIKQCGMAELTDGITSTFIKGEKTLSSSMPLKILSKLATGNEIGCIGDKTHISPLITDFESNCEKFGLSYKTSIPKDVDVPLFAAEKSSELSKFFHRLDFLDCDFAKMLKGPDLHRNKDRSRVRESWRYKRTPNVDSILTDHTAEGTTIKEACLSVAKKRLRAEHRLETAAEIAVDCFLMGLPLGSDDIRLIENILMQDGDFFSLGAGMHRFEMLFKLEQLYETEYNSSLVQLEKCFGKLLSALPSMADIPTEQAGDCIKIMKIMYSASDSILTDMRETFGSVLLTLAESDKKEPSVYGAAMGLLYAMDPKYGQAAKNAMKGYLKGSSEVRKQGTGYLKGLFETARDIALADNSFTKMTNTLLRDMEHEEFMEILPTMRLAFSYFTPSEVQTVAAAAAELNKTKSDNILYETAIDESLYTFGKLMDKEIMEEIR